MGFRKGGCNQSWSLTTEVSLRALTILLKEIINFGNISIFSNSPRLYLSAVISVLTKTYSNGIILICAIGNALLLGEVTVS